MLRLVALRSPRWWVDGDVNGDNLADFVIEIGNCGDILWASNYFLL